MVTTDIGVLRDRDGEHRARRPRVQVVVQNVPVGPEANAITNEELAINYGQGIIDVNERPPQQDAVPGFIDEFIANNRVTARLNGTEFVMPDDELRTWLSIFIENRRQAIVQPTRRNDVPEILEPSQAPLPESPQPGPQDPDQPQLDM